MYKAIDAGHTSVVSLLVEKNAKLNLEHESALHRAVLRDDMDIVTLLLKAKADINTKNSEGITPLMAARQAQMHDVVQLLVSHGAL